MLWPGESAVAVWRSEARRRAAMAGSVLAEQEAFYRGRELHVPDHY